MSQPASQSATQGFRPLSLGEWLTLMGLLAVVAIGAYDIGYRLGGHNSPTLNLQWGGPEGCGYGFTRVPIANWLGDGPGPTVCKPVPD